MTRLDLRYKFGPFNRRHVVHVPSCYAEMTTHQFVAMSMLCMGLIEEDEFIRVYFELFDAHYSMLDDFQKYKMLQTLDFWKTERPSGRIILNKISNYVGPNQNLTDVTLSQFMAIDTYFSWYNVTGKVEWLDKMMAMMYHIPGESFNPSDNLQEPDIEANIKAMSRLKPGIKLAAYVNWSFIKNWLSTVYKELFPKSIGESKPTPAKWLDVFDNFVGDNVAQMDKYKNMPCMDALRIMNKRIKEAKYENHRRIH